MSRASPVTLESDVRPATTVPLAASSWLSGWMEFAWLSDIATEFERERTTDAENQCGFARVVKFLPAFRFLDTQIPHST